MKDESKKEVAEKTIGNVFPSPKESQVHREEDPHLFFRPVQTEDGRKYAHFMKTGVSEKGLLSTNEIIISAEDIGPMIRAFVITFGMEEVILTAKETGVTVTDQMQEASINENLVSKRPN